MLAEAETHLFCVNEREKVVHFFIAHSVAPLTVGVVVYLMTAVQLEAFRAVVNELFQVLEERLLQLCVFVKACLRCKMGIVNVVVIVPDYLVRLDLITCLSLLFIGKVVFDTESETEMKVYPFHRAEKG